MAAPPSAAGPNPCGTEPPSRPPTFTTPLGEGWQGEHWIDTEGIWTRSPLGMLAGDLGIDLSEPSAQVDVLANHSLQAKLSAEGLCVVASDLRVGAPVVGEFPIEEPAGIEPLPWLRQEGTLFRAEDGRTTILRGVDYPYNEEILEAPYNLTEADFDRLASWGINLLRIRLSGARSGFYPGHAPEPGYFEHLDHLIEAANRRGIYVLPSTATGDWESLHLHLLHDRLKFLAGTPNHDHWMAFQAAVFERYRDHPGVVGFDPINEDDSFPPYIHDQYFMGPAHRKINALLRAHDQRHVYFQEPSGWSYWGAEHWPGMMAGADIGDPNRNFCPKWKVGTESGTVLDRKAELAAESNAPMFICEYWIDKENDSGYDRVIAVQREALGAMDARLLGGVRVLYGPSPGYGTFLRDGTESPWVQEFARPYPMWAGGTIEAIDFDFHARRLVTTFALDGSGATEIFVPQTRMYSQGFVATTSAGGTLVHSGSEIVEANGLSWDAATQRVVAPPQVGSLTITVEPQGA